jgi:hypothetical protein
MSHYFYDANTGLFLDKVLVATPEVIEHNTPSGYVAIRINDQFDPKRHKIDTATGDVVEREDHEMAQRPDGDIRAEERASIALLEEKSLRALREVVLSLLPDNDPRRARLQDLDSQIIAHREKFTQRSAPPLPLPESATAVD